MHYTYQNSPLVCSSKIDIDIENGVVTIARRDDLDHKTTIKIEDIATEVPTLLDAIQKNMLEKARAFRDAHIVTVTDMDGLTSAVNGGCFAKAMWCGDRTCEDKVKELTSASTRVMPFDQTPVGTKCVCCGKTLLTEDGSTDGKVIYFAKAY